MRRRLALFLVLSSLTALVPLAACGGSDAEPGRLPVTPDKEGGRVKTDSSEPVDIPETGAFPDVTSGGPGRVYAHTQDTLYLYEPVAMTLTVIGKFSCIDPVASNRDVVTDIAVDRTGRMFGSTFDYMLSIDPITAKCQKLPNIAGALDPPNGLTFVPAGTVDPGKETLVGFSTHYLMNDGVTYVKIDLTTGDIIPIGMMNASTTGPQYRSSGDLISLINDSNHSYASVKLQVDGGVEGTDLIAEIDPVNGNIKRIIGDTKERNLYGLGYWGGKGYGFTDTGRILEINMATGSSVVVKTLTEDGGPAPWYGAGVTTQAPIQ